MAIVYGVLATAQAETAKKIVGYYYGTDRPDYALSSVRPKTNMVAGNSH